MELIESLLFDAEATRGAQAAWMKDNDETRQNQEATSKSKTRQPILCGHSFYLCA